eukprot:9335813-Alexandrium_andersonii.AAC.1
MSNPLPRSPSGEASGPFLSLRARYSDVPTPRCAVPLGRPESVAARKVFRYANPLLRSPSGHSCRCVRGVPILQPPTAQPPLGRPGGHSCR